MQSYLILLSLRVKQLGSGSFLTSLEGHLIVEIESKGHCLTTMDEVGMNQGSW
jgi:hypothetical protein